MGEGGGREREKEGVAVLKVNSGPGKMRHKLPPGWDGEEDGFRSHLCETARPQPLCPITKFRHRDKARDSISPMEFRVRLYVSNHCKRLHVNRPSVVCVLFSI